MASAHICSIYALAAAMSFAESKPGRVALITLLEKAAEGIEGKTGTRVQM